MPGNAGKGKIKDKSAQGDSLQRDDAAALFFLKKAEKIVTAIHLITDFFPAGEPLRSSIRQKSIALLSRTFSAREKDISDSDYWSTHIGTTIHELVSLLRVARDAHFVSDMNFAVLEREFLLLFDLIGADSGFSRALLDSDFFSTGARLPEAISQKKTGVKLPRRESEPSRALNGSTNGASNGNGEGKRKPSSNKRRRRDAVISVLQERGQSSIADISKEIQGCSQKTIQRELLDLVDEGLVRKEGERRWSTYALVDGIGLSETL